MRIAVLLHPCVLSLWLITERSFSHSHVCSGYSGADVRALCTEAAMGPIRSCTDIRTMDADAVRPINLDDFVAALRGVR